MKYIDYNFEEEISSQIEAMKSDETIKRLSKEWFLESLKFNYSYHFKALGLPIIQYPTDIIALQEIIWDTKPDLIIESGIARGGSVVHNASQLALLDYVDIIEGVKTLSDPRRHVVAIDIDIRQKNRNALENHALAPYFTLIEGSSIDADVISRVHSISGHYENILVLLDSNHTKEHVKKELDAYASLVSVNNYCIVYDTVIEELPDIYSDRPWSVGNSPMNAVDDFLRENRTRFIIDDGIDAKLQFSVAPRGYLKRVED